MSQILKFFLNHQPVELLIQANNTLLEVLRDKLNVISPKTGCNRGDCGSCTVILNGKAIKSCITLAATVEGKKVLTLEGLIEKGKIHPIQQAFIDFGAPQCGYCTPGMVMAAKAFLDINPNPTREEVKEGLSGNLCRCTGYEFYVDAVLAVAGGKYSNNESCWEGSEKSE